MGVDVPVARAEAPGRGDWTPWANTPLEDAISSCTQSSRYFSIPPEAFIGISYAESSFTRFPPRSFNHFGIMGMGELRMFKNWGESCDEMGALLKYRYFADGLDTPEKIMPRYVGYRSDSWTAAVRKYWK